ncbi:MAG: ArsR family transcriptional regulator [Candidatus Hodarchaeales archaeon]|jgi:DNA-binding MarR family transcriptional regulator
MMKTSSSNPRHLSPSCEVILGLLTSSGPMTPTEINKLVSFSSRTVREALKTLLARELVHKLFVLTDARQRIYQAS